MTDKIKVNLSYYVYKTILHDMYRFEFFKSNGEVNKNDFLNTVIYNFYYNKLKKRAELREKLANDAILTDVSARNRNRMLDACSVIMDDYYNKDLHYHYHDASFTIYPTRMTNDFFDQIYENEIKDKTSYSSFIRKLLNEYAYLPQYVRESVAKRSEVIDLSAACENGRVVVFKTRNKEHRIAPYRIIRNFEETFSYLLGLDMESKGLKPISIKVSKIYNVIITKAKYKFSKEQKEKFEDIFRHRVEFASGEMVRVRIEVTKRCDKMLGFKFHNQPPMKQISENILEVSTTIPNFLSYFIPFGKEIKILDNPELKEKMASFYSSALENYKD